LDFKTWLSRSRTDSLGRKKKKKPLSVDNDSLGRKEEEEEEKKNKKKTLSVDDGSLRRKKKEKKKEVLSVEVPKPRFQVLALKTWVSRLRRTNARIDEQSTSLYK
jgi:hypothetical protein